MNIYTIGFTSKTAREFFEALNRVDARYLLDIRLHNNSQLAGFTKKGNIEYFTQQLTRLTYLELPALAPADEMFRQYRDDKDWPLYEKRYMRLMLERNITDEIDRRLFEDGATLLCTEPTPEKCHRRLAAEFLKEHLFHGSNIVHL